MIDRVVVSSNRREATFIYDNREPFVVSSDNYTSLLELILFFLGMRVLSVKVIDEVEDKWPQPSTLEDTFKVVA